MTRHVSIHPLFGPEAGGTLLTLSGRYLENVDIPMVFIGTVGQQLCASSYR